MERTIFLILVRISVVSIKAYLLKTKDNILFFLESTKKVPVEHLNNTDLQKNFIFMSNSQNELILKPKSNKTIKNEISKNVF